MDTQFDNEPIDFINPNEIYYCSPRATSSGCTLLMKWCILHHRHPTIIDRIAEYIKEHPQSVNETNTQGWTPLIVSARNSRHHSSEAIVSLLIASGADVNAQDVQGWTALMAACRNSHLESTDTYNPHFT